MWVLPRLIMPAAMSLHISVAVCGAIRLRQAAVPPIATSPSISTRSLIAIGMPCSGPTAWPARIALSAEFGGESSVGGVDRDESLQPGFQALDARDALVHQIDRRQAARANLRGQRVDGTEGGGGHGTLPTMTAAAIMRYASGQRQGSDPPAPRVSSWPAQLAASGFSAIDRSRPILLKKSRVEWRPATSGLSGRPR